MTDQKQNPQEQQEQTPNAPKPNRGRFQKGSERAREAGRKGGRNSR